MNKKQKYKAIKTIIKKEYKHFYETKDLHTRYSFAIGLIFIIKFIANNEDLV